MAESQRHVRLVNALFAYVVRAYLDGDDGPVFVDDGSPGRRPPTIAGHTPDIFVPSRGKYGIILGEAETARSLEKAQTASQIKAFMGACESTGNSVFILAVPWDRVRLASSIIRDIQRKGVAQNTEAIVLERLVI
jgi:hypothetical protein